MLLVAKAVASCNNLDFGSSFLLLDFRVLAFVETLLADRFEAAISFPLTCLTDCGDLFSFLTASVVLEVRLDKVLIDFAGSGLVSVCSARILSIFFGLPLFFATISDIFHSTVTQVTNQSARVDRYSRCSFDILEEYASWSVEVEFPTRTSIGRTSSFRGYFQP